jgi:hypothetical protein
MEKCNFIPLIFRIKIQAVLDFHEFDRYHELLVPIPGARDHDFSPKADGLDGDKSSDEKSDSDYGER